MFSTAHVDAMRISLWKSLQGVFANKHLSRGDDFLTTCAMFSTAFVDAVEANLWKSITTIWCARYSRRRGEEVSSEGARRRAVFSTANVDAHWKSLWIGTLSY